MRADQARQILNVGPGAAPQQVRKAYRRLALQYHPDKNKTAEAKVKFAELQEALGALASGANAAGAGDGSGSGSGSEPGSGPTPSAPGHGDVPTAEALHRAEQFKAKLASLHPTTLYKPDIGRIALHHANLCRAATPTVQMRSTAERTFDSVQEARKWTDETGEPLLASWLEPRWSYEYEQQTLDRWARRGASRIASQSAHRAAAATV